MNEQTEKLKQNEKRAQHMLTEGVIWKEILSFFFPILIGALFQQLYNTVDAVVVGQFAGKEALASVGGSSGQILNFVFSFFVGLSTGATVIIAQYFGARAADKVDDALHTAYTFALTGGLVLGILGVIFTVPLLALLETPANLMENSTTYVRILFGGLVFTLIYNMGSGILRAVGDSRRPLYILIACCGINIVLDLLFVMGLGLGVFGAAVATDISQASSAVLVTYLLVKRTPGMQLRLRHLHMTGAVLGRILRIGLPTALAGSMFSISNMILQTSINRMGIDEVAAWTAYGKIDALWWLINQAFSTSITTFVGQNYGAGKADRIRKGTWEVLAMEVTAGIAASLIFICFGKYLLALFTDDAHVVELGVMMARLITPFYAVFALSEIFSSTLRAEGYVMVSTIANLVGVCIYRIIWVVWVYPGGTLHQVLTCYPVSWILISLFVTVYYAAKQRKILARVSA